MIADWGAAFDYSGHSNIYIKASDALLLYALRRRKVQKHHGFRDKSAYGHCISKMRS